MTANIAKRNIIETVVLDYKDRFEGALAGGSVSFDPFLAAVLSDSIKNPRLLEATKAAPETMVECLMVCANAKLLPGGAHDQFYLIPRYNGIRKRLEVTYIIGYKGLCDIAYRHPRVHAVEAFLVYEGEKFEFDPGEGKVTHGYSWDIDRTDDKIVGGYAKATLTDPAGHHVIDKPVIWVMSRKEIDAIRDRSSAYKDAEKRGKANSPWHTDYAAMARKTVLRALLNRGSVPRRHELAEALGREMEAEKEAVYEEIQVEAEAAPKGETRADELKGRLGIDMGTPKEMSEDDYWKQMDEEPNT